MTPIKNSVSINTAAAMIAVYLNSNLVPFIVGSPGLGKSAIVHKYAKDNNLKVIDLRLAQCDPTELNAI